MLSLHMSKHFCGYTYIYEVTIYTYLPMKQRYHVVFPFLKYLVLLDFQIISIKLNYFFLVFQIEEVIQIPYEQTTCSKRAYDRGLGQKVIGFSYYGDSRSAHHQSKKYFQGIKNNLELLLKYYPDNWIIRQVFKGRITGQHYQTFSYCHF